MAAVFVVKAGHLWITGDTAKSRVVDISWKTLIQQQWHVSMGQ